MNLPTIKSLATALALASTTILTTTTTMAQDSASNLQKGQAFLKENATKPGVHTTPSGLQYKVITEGHGRSPVATDTVLVHYRGTTIDGTEFDSSYKRNEPISFPLNGVIPGWTEGVQLMKEGGKMELFIPSNLAYGSRGAGGVIAPDSTLIFDIELLKVQ
jgi:FKBP-type peptidyl-prolyl cis-trans isomerase